MQAQVPHSEALAGSQRQVVLPRPHAKRLQLNCRSAEARKRQQHASCSILSSRRHRQGVHSGSHLCHVAAVESQPNQLKVMIAGAPAAGKGTQCSRIVEEKTVGAKAPLQMALHRPALQFGLVHISVGDLLRAEVEAGTPAGQKAQQYMDAGNLVPNEVVVEMVTNRLSEADVREHGWLLDGYPRSGGQADAIEQQGIRPDVFILITVPDDLLVERVTGRRMDPETGEIYHLKFKPPPEDVQDRLIQRSDDTAEKMKTRIATHNSNVEAVLGYYKDITVEVDGTKSMEEVFDEIHQCLQKVVQERQKVLAH